MAETDEEIHEVDNINNNNNHDDGMEPLLSLDELKMIKDVRIIIEQEFLNRKITPLEFLKQKIKQESDVVYLCLDKINDRFEKNNFNFNDYDDLGNHVLSLYAELFDSYPLETSSLVEFIEFCSNCFLDFICKTKDYCKNILCSEMLLYHEDPQVYTIIVEYMFEINDVESSRTYIKKGIQLHEDCTNLYVEYFWIEVQYAHISNGASIPIALKKYHNFISGRFQGDMLFHFTLLDKAAQIVSQHRPTVNDLLCTVIKDMIKLYRLNELMWQKLATINYNGLIFEHDTQITYYSSRYLKQIQNSIETYELGLKENLPSQNKYNLWAYYIEHLINILNSFRMQNSQIRNFMIEKMLKMVESEEEKSLPIWNLLIIYASKPNLKLDMTKICSICPFEEINHALKPSYLEWFTETNNIQFGRALFNELKYVEPKSKALFLKMIDIEKSQPNIDINLISELYLELCIAFGSDDINVWLDRIKFQYMIDNRCAANQAYVESKFTLQPELCDIMTAEYKKCKDVFKQNL